MDKVIVAVVTTVLCSIFTGESGENKVSKEDSGKATKVETFEVEGPSKGKDIVTLDNEETSEK